MRAHLFQGQGYYPDRFYDYQKSFADGDEAVDYAENNPGSHDWWEVIISDDKGLHLYDSGYYP